MTYSSSDDDDTTEDDVPSPCSAPQVQYHAHDPQSLSPKCNLHASIHLEEEDKEEDFQTILLDDEHWTTELLKKFQTDHYIYTNIHYHMDYTPTCVHIRITKPPLILKPWI